MILPLVVAMLLAGCGRQPNEVAEGLALARLLRRLSPDANGLVRREREIANELRINLEQSRPPDQQAKMRANEPQAKPDQPSSGDFTTFLDNLRRYEDALLMINARMTELRQQAHDGNFQTPLVQVVQHDAETEFQNRIDQIDGFVTLAKDIELRAKLGRKSDFPEVDTLSHQLDLFLTQPREEALGSQIETLKSEYRLTDTQIGT